MDIESISNIVVAGAGIMGTSIAGIFAKNGYNVTVFCHRASSIEKGRQLIHVNQQTSIKEGIISENESEQLLKNIIFTVEENCFDVADFVIESIVEKLNVKHEFWKMVSLRAKKDAILTSNTSGLSITKLAEAVDLPERFSGFHWVNPPHIVPLIEIIKGEKTSEETSQVIYKLAEKIGKKPVLIKDAKGFCLNRFQFAVLREAMHIVESGIASKEDVDNVFKYGLGIRYACLGPFEIADLGGLDTFYNIASYLFEDLSDRKDVPNLLKDCYENKEFGVKNGKGFYDYSNGRDQEIIKKRDADFIKISKCLYE